MPLQFFFGKHTYGNIIPPGSRHPERIMLSEDVVETSAPGSEGNSLGILATTRRS